MSEQPHGPVESLDDLSLFDHLAAIDSGKMFQESLAALARDPIQSNDTVALLLLAEEAERWRQWQSAALLFAHVMIGAFAETGDSLTLTNPANRIVLLTAQRSAKFSSRCDVLLYSYRRVAACLRDVGMREPHIGEWMRIALSELLCSSKARAEAAEAALTAICPEGGVIESRYKSEVGGARRVLKGAQAAAARRTAPPQGADRGPQPNIGFLVGAVAITGVAAWWLRGVIAYPGVSTLFRDSNLLGAALGAWPVLLIATWIFGLFESRRTCALYFISPSYLAADEKIIVGEVMPFYRDWFFHIFQFIWFPFMVIGLLLFQKYDGLVSALQSTMLSPSHDSGTLAPLIEALSPSFLPQLPQGAGHLDRVIAVFGSDLVALLFASGLTALFLANQVFRVQRRRRKTGTNMYWWDQRISHVEWLVRLFMVGVDIFLSVFLILKVVTISLVAWSLAILAAHNVLPVSYFSPDGVGGLKFLTDILMNLSWLVFAFGLFVIASVYLHWNLLEYRATDALLLAVYVVALCLTMLPLVLLELRLDAAKTAVLSGLPVPATGAQLVDAAKYVRDIATLDQWRVSAISIGVLGNPVLPLSFQFLVMVVQYFVRAGKFAKMWLPDALRSGADNETVDAR
jgi:hypothetical protein